MGNREAARFLLTLSDASVRVSVNITAFDLATPKFVPSVLQVLAQENCPPNRLILEVTETAALSDRERASDILSDFRSHGIQIALDDFGTGYSSLAILQEMPLDEMKVDRSFVTDLGEVERKKAVLEAMIEVGHRLGLTVTIEGSNTKKVWTGWPAMAAMSCRALCSVGRWMHKLPVIGSPNTGLSNHLRLPIPLARLR